MYGAIIGDICGCTYEFKGFKMDNPAEIPLPALGVIVKIKPDTCRKNRYTFETRSTE